MPRLLPSGPRVAGSPTPVEPGYGPLAMIGGRVPIPPFVLLGNLPGLAGPGLPVRGATATVPAPRRRYGPLNAPHGGGVIIGPDGTPHVYFGRAPAVFDAGRAAADEAGRVRDRASREFDKLRDIRERQVFRGLGQGRRQAHDAAEVGKERERQAQARQAERAAIDRAAARRPLMTPEQIEEIRQTARRMGYSFDDRDLDRVRGLMGWGMGMVAAIDQVGRTSGMLAGAGGALDSEREYRRRGMAVPRPFVGPFGSV